MSSQLKLSILMTLSMVYPFCDSSAIGGSEWNQWLVAYALTSEVGP